MSLLPDLLETLAPAEAVARLTPRALAAALRAAGPAMPPESWWALKVHLWGALMARDLVGPFGEQPLHGQVTAQTQAVAALRTYIAPRAGGDVSPHAASAAARMYAATALAMRDMHLLVEGTALWRRLRHGAPRAQTTLVARLGVVPLDASDVYAAGEAIAQRRGVAMWRPPAWPDELAPTVAFRRFLSLPAAALAAADYHMVGYHLVNPAITGWTTPRLGEPPPPPQPPRRPTAIPEDRDAAALALAGFRLVTSPPWTRGHDATRIPQRPFTQMRAWTVTAPARWVADAASGAVYCEYVRYATLDLKLVRRDDTTYHWALGEGLALTALDVERVLRDDARLAGEAIWPYVVRRARDLDPALDLLDMEPEVDRDDAPRGRAIRQHVQLGDTLQAAARGEAPGLRLAMLAYLLAPTFRQHDADVLMSRLMSPEGVRMFVDAGLDSPGATADLAAGGQSCASPSFSSSSSW